MVVLRSLIAYPFTNRRFNNSPIVRQLEDPSADPTRPGKRPRQVEERHHQARGPQKRDQVRLAGINYLLNRKKEQQILEIKLDLK